MVRFGPKSYAILAFVPLILTGILLVSPAPAQVVRVFEQYGVAHASAGAYCPPDQVPDIWETTETTDLEDYSHTAQSDTASVCGSASAVGSLMSRIAGSTISVVMSCSSTLEGHRESQGAANFQIDFEVTATVAYTMSVQGSFAHQDSVGTTGWYIQLNGIHRVQDAQPDVDVTWTGHLRPGDYTLSGLCNSSRVTMHNIGDLWFWGDGTATLTGSVTLEFSEGIVVEIEPVSLGSLKARFR